MKYAQRTYLLDWCTLIVDVRQSVKSVQEFAWLESEFLPGGLYCGDYRGSLSRRSVVVTVGSVFEGVKGRDRNVDHVFDEWKEVKLLCNWELWVIRRRSVKVISYGFFNQGEKLFLSIFNSSLFDSVTSQLFPSTLTVHYGHLSARSSCHGMPLCFIGCREVW